MGIYDERDRKAKEQRKNAQNEASKKSSIAVAAGDGKSSPKVLTEALANTYKRLYVSDSHDQNRRLPYRKTTDNILSASGRVPAAQNKPNVSSFSGWVFSTYAANKLSPLELDQRTEDEFQIDAARKSVREASRKQELNKLCENYIEEVEPAGWRVIYKHFGSYEADALKISALELKDGSCMFGKPDLVFYHKKTKKFLIVEIKSTNAPVPSDGWPNLRAQLWAYSKADYFKEGSEIMLRAEVYNRRNFRSAPVKLAFDNDQVFHDENSKLFSRYVELSAGDEQSNLD